jgi:hypothetical protein
LYPAGRTAKEKTEVRDKTTDTSIPKKKRHLKRNLFIFALFAIVGYYYGFQLDEEKRSRMNKLLFEGREMWFRLFV